MAISRSQLVKELEPGLNALFGMEYDRYENQHAEIFDTESSDRAFEEEGNARRIWECSHKIRRFWCRVRQCK